MTTPSPAAKPRRGRPRGIRIQRRRSARTGVAYLYGDFRSYVLSEQARHVALHPVLAVISEDVGNQRPNGSVPA